LDAKTGVLFDQTDTSSRKKRGRKTDSVGRLTFSLIYVSSASHTEDPIGVLLERLRHSDAFMRKMDLAQLEAAEKGVWDGKPVIFFRGLLLGAAKEQ